jgi:hypothetical protein
MGYPQYDRAVVSLELFNGGKPDPAEVSFVVMPYNDLNQIGESVRGQPMAFADEIKDAAASLFKPGGS